MAYLNCDLAGSSQCGFYQSCVNSSSSTLSNPVYDCVHDPIFPATIYGLIVYALTPFYTGLALLGGLGALVLEGPVLEIQLNYYQYDATQIAYALTIGACFANTILLLFEKNPEYKQRPLVNFNIALIFSCAISIGANIGTFLQSYTPLLATLIIEQIFLVTVLSYLVFKCINFGICKGLKLNKIEKQVRNQFSSEVYVDNYSQLRLTDTASPFMGLVQDDQLINSSRAVGTNNEKVMLFNEYEKNQNSIFPKKTLAIMLSFFLVTQLFLRIAIFNQSQCKNLEKILITLIVNLVMTVGVYYLGRNDEVRKNSCLFQMDERYYNPKSFALIYFSGFGSGFVSGFIGYGAGLVAVPAMLYLNVLPRVATATSAFLLFGLSLNEIIVLSEEGGIDAHTILFFFSLAFIGGSVVTKIGYKLMDKYNLSQAVILIVILFDVLNIVSGLIYTLLQSQRFQFNYLIDAKQRVEC